MREPLQHSVFSRIPKSGAPAYEAVNGTPYFVYASLTVAPDLELVELEPFADVHLNDTFAAREKQPFVLIESLCVAGKMKQTHGISCKGRRLEETSRKL